MPTRRLLRGKGLMSATRPQRRRRRFLGSNLFALAALRRWRMRHCGQLSLLLMTKRPTWGGWDSHRSRSVFAVGAAVVAFAQR